MLNAFVYFDFLKQVLKPLQKLAASPLVDVRREVARAFALFASKRDSHQDILQCGGLQQMVSFLRSDDPKCERFGALRKKIEKIEKMKT